VFTEESFRFSRDGYPTEASWKELDVGRRESGLLNASDQGNATARFLLGSALRIRNHQFHNTSGTARPRGKWSIDDGRWLKEDAGNVASFLYRLQQDQPRYYTRIVETIGLVLPFFSDFALDPEYGYVLLRWRERGSDYLFSAGQAADGMLRILALISLLQQPETDLPNILILDEPELGLHPHAIQILADLIRSASQYAQVIIATQSVSLIDQFEPRDIVVVDRLDGESSFRRLSKTELDDWLADYSLSELWEKNVIGGRPQRRPVNT
jgi:predicted ATPase